VAVSGGADSLALALLARDWAWARGGRVTALVVDHGLRPESVAEAATTLERLGALGIAAQGLALHGLAHGPALAARARAARHAILATAARHLGVLHLLFGHHAGDQAETVAMRRLSGSGEAGLAGMAALVETDALRLLRPLLTIPPGRLRACLRAAGMAWVEDPSNTNPAALRSRLRHNRGDAAGDGVLTRAAVQAATARGQVREAAERAVAKELAARVRLHPQGYAVLSPGPLSTPALAALLRGLAGAAHAPSPGQVTVLAAAPHPATLGGVRVQPAGRLGPGWLLTREVAALAPPVPARPGAVWDGRFRLAGPSDPPEGARIAALGPAAASLRGLLAARMLPAAVLATLPAVWCDAELVAVPHLGYPDDTSCHRVRLDFALSMPIAGAPFVPATGG
jgi:tRNA(Ile)-lysidine synthase